MRVLITAYLAALAASLLFAAGSVNAAPTPLHLVASGAARPLTLVALGDSIPYGRDCGGCIGYVQLFAQAAGRALGVPIKVDNRAEHNNLDSKRLLAQITLAPETVVHTRLIAAQVAARYRLLPGRKLTVTEATSMEVVHSVTLVTPVELLRDVPADNGIYFALCSVGARCPYPARAAWPAAAFLPRRLALELALRAFLETRLTLVVVALPTAEPVWVVFERDDLLGAVDAPAALDRLALELSRRNPALHELVDHVTGPRLFRPLPLLPPPTDTIYALRLL